MVIITHNSWGGGSRSYCYFSKLDETKHLLQLSFNPNSRTQKRALRDNSEVLIKFLIDKNPAINQVDILYHMKVISKIE